MADIYEFGGQTDDLQNSASEGRTNRACRGANPDIFFRPLEAILVEAGVIEIHPDYKTALEDSEAQRIAAARAICRSCLNEKDCLEEAIDKDEADFWGGTTKEERQGLIYLRRMSESMARHPSRFYANNVVTVNFHRTAEGRQ